MTTAEAELAPFDTVLRQNHRMEDDTLSGKLSSVDVATTENLDNLVKFAEKLLKKPVSRMNVDTGSQVPYRTGVTNEDALKTFAKKLSSERKVRVSEFQKKNESK